MVGRPCGLPAAHLRRDDRTSAPGRPDIPAGTVVAGYFASMFRLRLCARPGCGAPATAVLIFQYSTRTVWLLDPAEPDPAAIDLCARHADRTAPPKGWTGHDRRAGASGVSTPVAS